MKTDENVRDKKRDNVLTREITNLTDNVSSATFLRVVECLVALDGIQNPNNYTQKMNKLALELETLKELIIELNELLEKGESITKDSLIAKVINLIVINNGKYI
ncbi:MAG: hypothetical protein ACK5B9_13735 [Flavobacteriia bacterium]|jgi:hypothetical protein